MPLAVEVEIILGKLKKNIWKSESELSTISIQIISLLKGKEDQFETLARVNKNETVFINEANQMKLSRAYS